MAFTELCCRSGGSNLNAGTRQGTTTEPGTSADLTYAAGTWTNATRTFTVASGNPSTDGVVAGDFVALDTTGGTPPATYGGRVSSVTATTIVIDASRNWGTNPSGTGPFTLRVGGAWLGPNGASGFPLTMGLATATNGTSDPVRLNLKNDQVYAVTASITMGTNNVQYLHGYTTAYGDGGRAIIDGGTTGTSYGLFKGSPNANAWWDSLWIRNNGSTTPASTGVGFSNADLLMTHCIISGFTGAGVFLGVTNLMMVECEAYGNNTLNAGSTSAVSGGGATVLLRCCIHDNTTSNTMGVFQQGGMSILIDSIFDTNGKSGVDHSSSNVFLISGCDFYSNTGNTGGFSLSFASRGYIESSNFVKNTGWGIASSAVSAVSIVNCGFGSGTQANGSGTIQSARMVEIGRVNYASGVTPWADPANGDFRVSLAAAKSAGRGLFTQTSAGYGGTVAYVDIGSGQHQEVASGGPANFAF